MKAIKSGTYTSPFTNKEVRVILCAESLWMTQLQMSELFGCDVREVHIVLKALFASEELDRSIVNRAIEIENYEGNYVSGNFYNLDAITAVGYRLNPKETTHFHIWSSQVLRHYIFTLQNRHNYGIIESIKRKVSHMLAVA